RQAERKPAQHRGSGGRAERNGQPGRARRITASVVTEESAMVIEPTANTKKRPLRKINRLRAHAVWRRTTLIPLANFLNAASSMALCGRAGLVRSWLAAEHIVSS